MDTVALTLDLPTEADTVLLGRAFAQIVHAGDCLLLEGAIGAGKSHLARALIRALRGEAEEVPSPTFTLVQTYPGDPDIWHADLYRLTHPDEVQELGLEDAYKTAICLIEWPDRLGKSGPKNSIRVTLKAKGEGRLAIIHPGDRPDNFAKAILASIREQKTAAFLHQTGWSHALRTPLAGDASARRYERLRGPSSAILMDAPPGQADSVADFIIIDRHLRDLGLSAPQIVAQDTVDGFLLLEDLGDGLYPAIIAADPATEIPLYEAATDVLLHIQSHPPAVNLPDLSAQDWAETAAIAIDCYQRAALGISTGRDDFVSVLAETLIDLADGPRVMILRDYHAENLLYLPNRVGLARTGLLDFQLAQLGQPGYDLVSLLQDARRDVSLSLESAMILRFAESQHKGIAAFETSYAALGALRALRILGIFARLCLQDGKQKYLALIPRVWAHLQRNLSHPALFRLQKVCTSLLPVPDTATLQRLEAQCSAFR